MIDSHCHLDHEPLLSDLPNVIKRSKEVGIKKLLTISTSLESFDRIKKIVEEDEIIFGTIGIHPHETANNKITSDIIIKNSLLSRDEKIISFSTKLKIFKAFKDDSGIIGYNKKLIFLTISNVV